MSKKFSTALGAAFAVVLVTAIGAFAAVTAGNTGWHWGNPLPQGNTLTSMDTFGDRVYAAGATGTLVRSDDAGATWTGLRTGLLDDIRRVRALGPDSIVFAGSCALRRSDNAGATVRRLAWSPSDETCSVSIQSFYFPTSAVGFLLLGNGDIFTTEDSGDSWSKKTALPGGKSTGDIWFTSASTGVASAGGALYKTTDGANSWSPAGSGNVTNFEFLDADNGYAVTSDGGVLKTIDGGSAWTNAVAGGGPTPGVGGDAANLSSIACADLTTCLATNVKGTQLLRTTDSAAHWSSVVASNSPIYAAGLTSPTRAVAVGGGGATVVSDDSGQAWSTISSAVLGEYFELHAESPTLAFAFGAHGALARTTNGGNSWNPVGVSTSNQIYDVSFPTPERGYVLDAAGVVLRTNNAGASWQFLDTGTTAKPLAMLAPTTSSVVIIGPKGARFSVDNGDSFAAGAGKNLKKTSLTALDKAGGALFAYSRTKAFTSRDGGKKWTAVKLPRVKVKDLDMINSKSGYILDTRNELLVTRTGGKKWTRIETTGAGFAASVAFGDMTHGYLTDNTGRVLYTADGAKTWSRQYPFYSKDGGENQVIDAPSGTSAFMLTQNSNHIFATSTGGQIGNASSLTIKASSKKVKKNTVIKLTGKLLPNSGGERVTVLARQIGAKAGTKWVSQERTVAANGTFTTSWKIKKNTIFIARWSGDSARDGDGAPAITVKVKK